MHETLNPRSCPMCNSRRTNVTSNGRTYRYAMVCKVCQCRWKVFNRRSRFSPIEIIEQQGGTMTTLQKLIDTIVTKLKPRYNDSYIASLVKPMHKLSTVKDFIADMECQGYNVFIDHNADGGSEVTIYIKGIPRHYELTMSDYLGDPAVWLTRIDGIGYFVEAL